MQNFYPEYKDYNKVVVTINGYIVSNVNKARFPSNNCQAHLESLTIESAAVSTDNSQNIGAKGTINIIDYKNAVFNNLTNHLSNYINDLPNVDKKTLCPPVTIEISCFTGTRTFKGHILNWSTQFVGSTPTISLNWSVICPSNDIKIDKNANQASSQLTDIFASGGMTYNNPSALIDAAQRALPKEKIAFILNIGDVSYQGSDIDKKIKFNDGRVLYDSTKYDSSGNKLIDVYKFVTENAVTKDTNQPLFGCISESNSEQYIVAVKDPQKNAQTTETSQAGASLVYIQNGKYQAYSSILIDKAKYTVIPMTSFSFDTEFNKLILQPSILGNLNGNKLISSNQSCQTNCSVATTKNDKAAESKNQSSDAITISFDCYNSMLFDCNNSNAPIIYRVYNEVGQEHIVSGQALVRKCTYTISGAVVKASLECTKVFNNTISTTTEIVPASTSTTDNNTMKSSMSEARYTYKSYLCSEDEWPISISFDKTSECLSNGVFKNHIDVFLKKYAKTTKDRRLLPYDYISTLIKAGNFGLLTLLIGVANYGISDAPLDRWHNIDNTISDAILLDPDYHEGIDTAFCATKSAGKSAFSYASGGLGIADWDDANLKDIYTMFGFEPDIDKLHFESLIVKKDTGKITNWVNFKYAGLDRIKPIFDKEAKMLKFDEGLRQDNQWKKWSKNIVTATDNDGQYIFQYDLFKLWITKFWQPTINGLKQCSVTEGHTISLQDAIRISRAGNSATGLIDKSVGKSVADQYNLYLTTKKYTPDHPRYMRQKGFCRRCADIVGYEMHP